MMFALVAAALSAGCASPRAQAPVTRTASSSIREQPAPPPPAIDLAPVHGALATTWARITHGSTSSHGTWYTFSREGTVTRRTGVSAYGGDPTWRMGPDEIGTYVVEPNGAVTYAFPGERVTQTFAATRTDAAGAASAATLPAAASDQRIWPHDAWVAQSRERKRFVQETATISGEGEASTLSRRLTALSFDAAPDASRAGATGAAVLHVEAQAKEPGRRPERATESFELVYELRRRSDGKLDVVFSDVVGARANAAIPWSLFLLERGITRRYARSPRVGDLLSHAFTGHLVLDPAAPDVLTGDPPAAFLVESPLPAAAAATPER